MDVENIFCNIYTLSALDQNPGGYLLYTRNYCSTQLHRNYNKPIYKDPYTPTSMNHGMSHKVGPGDSFT